MAASIHTVETALQKTAREIQRYGLNDMLVFNSAYQIITAQIQVGLQNNLFRKPKLVELLDIEFANFYFRALDEYYMHKKLPGAWQKLLKCSNKPAFIKLLIGANAHINHDLPMALAKLSLNQQTAIKNDFFATDTIFRQSSKEIIHSFEEPNQLFRFIKNHFRLLYEKPIIAIIIHWRHRAWKNSQALRHGRINQEDLVKHSNQIANSLIDLSIFN